MKKQLLIIPALIFAGSALAQNARVKPVGVRCMSERLGSKFRLEDPKQNYSTAAKPAEMGPQQEIQYTEEELRTAATTAATWQIVGGSRNIYGVLYSASEPLHYNDNLNAVSFIHRASTTYTGHPSVPASESGVIVAEISLNWGASWDSTCFFADPSNYGRYPQGAIYNPQSNLNINNAYIVGSGPVTDGSNWVAGWFASKQLGTANYNYTASTVPNAMQAISNNPPYPSYGKMDYPTYGFAANDDGKVKALGVIANDINGTTNAQFGYRGAMLMKGTFNAGVFSWTGDSICPATVMRTDGSKQMWGTPQMAWDEGGQVGYVVQLGAAATATGSNKGWQPIVYKTTNYGASWAQINGIDFNLPAFNALKDHIYTIQTNTNLTVPFFKFDEGWDLAVDNLGKLHIVSTIVGTSSTDPDSLDYTYPFGTEQYAWAHSPGQQPYIYDFIGDGTGTWTVVTIDSLGSEGPSDVSGQPGFNDNPWDIDPSSGNKVRSDSRIQVSRTIDGAALIYTWAESDSNFTAGAKKWNTLPNVKARAMNALTQVVSPTEINVTKPSTGANAQVANRAMFHFGSPECALVSCAGTTTSIKLPMTVSNSAPYAQLTSNRHWYSSAPLDFVNLGCPTGIKQNQNLAYNVNGIEIYPNPASSNVVIAVNVKEEAQMKIEIYSLVGQLVKSIQTNAVIGDNTVNANLNNLTPGIYMVKVQAGNTTSTKKLVIE
jgi:hypothetical protein